ncbi:MAG: hypothetical protein EAZ55_11780 [Cytophagales bacterium]|nr:MAG: hypothetical protein EAZ55_11780 [Cytophagales bacterium]
MQRYIYFSFLLIFLGACEDPFENGYDRKAIAQEVKNRKIKKISEGQLLEFTQTLGNQLVVLLEKNDAKAQELLQKYETKANFFLFKGENKKFVFSKEKEILEAYQYNIEKGLPIESNIQNIVKEQIIVFNAPYQDKNGKVVGMWSIHFPRSQVVKNVDAKILK